MENSAPGAIRHAAASLFLGSAILQPCVEARAAEYGLITHQQGLFLPMTAYTPPPGVYFYDAFWLYHGSGALYSDANASAAVRARQVTYDFRANIAAVAWYTDMELFGGKLGFANVSGVGSNKTSVATAAGRAANEIASFGDTEFSMLLSWRAGDNHWKLSISEFVPTGNYDKARLPQTGLNRPGLDVKGAYTFFNPENGVEFTGALGFTLNGANNATDYQSGVDLHFEWAAMEHLPFGLAMGVGGYLYQQISDDHGAGAIYGPFRGRVAAIGPIATYQLKAGEQQVNFTARWFHEFAAENRVSGDTIYGTLSFPLYNPPPTVARD